MSLRLATLVLSLPTAPGTGAVVAGFGFADPRVEAAQALGLMPVAGFGASKL
jgi:hypothetical protein